MIWEGPLLKMKACSTSCKHAEDAEHYSILYFTILPPKYFYFRAAFQPFADSCPFVCPGS